MEDQENTNMEETKSIDVIVEEYEKKLQDTKDNYERRIREITENHVNEIRTLMRTGSSPQAEEIKHEEEEKPMDEQILANLRLKYKLN